MTGRHLSVHEIQERLAREESGVGWTHDAPTGVLTTCHAQRIMRQHRDCRIDECARKRAAWKVLIPAATKQSRKRRPR